MEFPRFVRAFARPKPEHTYDPTAEIQALRARTMHVGGIDLYAEFSDRWGSTDLELVFAVSGVIR